MPGNSTHSAILPTSRFRLFDDQEPTAPSSERERYCVQAAERFDAVNRDRNPQLSGPKPLIATRFAAVVDSVCWDLSEN